MKRLYGESSRTSTSAVAESLTEDLVIEILLRLPVKSLIRFKCVAKRWQSLISDPGFAKAHLQRLKTGDIISSQRIFKTRPIETINYEVLDSGIGGDDDHAVVRFHGPSIDVYGCDPGLVGLVGSCDGLVCLSGCGSILLYNPTTKECRKLPSSDLFQIGEFICGFGYDSRSDDYKIVQRKGPESWPKCSGEWVVVIFSLKSGYWRRVQAQLESYLYPIIIGRGVYWNGALHWVDLRKEKFKTLIISFDLSEEKFEQVLSFPEIHDKTCFKGLGIHGANLFMYCSTFNECFQVWTTSEYRKGGSWAKLFSVSTKGIPSYGCYQKTPIAYTRSGKIVFQFAWSRMILFDPKDNTYRDYPIQKGCDIQSVFCRQMKSVIYVETLVSPYLGREPSRI